MSTPFGLPLGIHHGIPEARYHAPMLGVISNSALDPIERSPAHYRAWLEYSRPPSKDQVFGRRVHCAILEPERFDLDHVVEPDFGDKRFKANKAKAKEWQESIGSRVEIISDEDMRHLRGMRAAVQNHPLASKLLIGGHPEVTVTWQDAETGLYGKCRLDYWLPERKTVVDLKTTDDASIEAFSKSCAKWNYPQQTAVYRSALAAVGEPAEHFVFLAVEKLPPYAVGTHFLNAEDVEKGYGRMRAAIDRLADAVKRDDWGAYPIGLTELELPGWWK